MSETFCLGALLAVIGGFLDAYTYLTRGRVFANAQTGNLVLLAMNLAGGQFQKAQYYLIPILAFIAGVLIAEVTCRCFQKGRRLHWRQIIILLEIITLASVAFLPAGNLGYGSQCFGCTGLFYPGARLPKNQWQSSCYHHVYRKSA